MTDVLLATCRAWPEGEPAGDLLVAELARRGVDAAWAVWDDASVDWAGARLVAVRSTWDYEHRREEFLAWARKVEQGARLVNPAAVLEWNTDKSYLVGLAETGLPVVPTLTAEDESELPPAIAAFDVAVVKPRVAAAGRGVVVFDGQPGGPADLDESMLEMGPWVVQPLVESVRSEGETSVFVLGGEVVAQAQKHPGDGEIRVQEEYGGRTEAVAVTDEAAALARRTLTVVQDLLGVELPVLRVDLMRLADGALVVSEVEATEAGLYLDVLPANAAAFADTVAGLLPPG